MKQKCLLAVATIISGFMLATIPASAGSPVSGSIVQSYNAGPTVLQSMLVEFKAKDKTTVIPLKSADINDLLGVVIPSNNATIVLTPESSTSQQVLVAPSGRYNVLLSNQNGAIKAGDYLTVSALPGIAMKADQNQPLIIGRAVAAFTGANSIDTVSLQTGSNAIHVSIGRAVADLQLAPNPLYLKTSNSILVFLTRAEFDVTNKPISPVRTYIVALVFLATVLITGVVLYTGTKTAINSIGRNPLARSTIGRSMIKTVGIGVVVFITGTATVYLILNK